jgi:predicted RNA-binding protein with PIN domain
MRTVILDGYNVILRSPAFQPDERQNLAMAREKLVNLLSWALGGTGQIEFIIVFDGADVGKVQRKTVISGGSTKVTVIFSQPPLKADDVIRTMVEEMGPRMSDLTVVTSDLEVARHARSVDATVVLSDLFAASLFKERVEEQLNEAIERGKQAQRGGKAAKAAKKKGPKTGSPTREGSDAEAKPEGVSKKNAAEWMKLFGEQQFDKEESDW